MQLYQAWLFTEVEGGTHVVTENVVRSPAPKALDALSAAWMKRLSDMWQAQVERLSDSSP